MRLRVYVTFVLINEYFYSDVLSDVGNSIVYV